MEYPSKNDFFLKFKAIYNDHDEFIDYILIDISKNCHILIDYKNYLILGKRISEIALESKINILGLKDFYYHMIPNARRKFEIYIEELENWYLVNIFSDGKDDLVMIYTDVTRYKKKDEGPNNTSPKEYEEEII